MTEWIRRAVVAGLLVAALAVPARGQDGPGADVGSVRISGPADLRREDAWVSLDVRGMPLAEVARRLSEISGTNIVPDAGVDGTVTVTLLEIPWRQALDLVCQRTGTVPREVSARLIRIVRPPRVTAEFRNSPLVEVLDVLAGKAGANIVIAPEVDGKATVTMRFQDIPWEDALEALVKTAGYAAVTEPSGIVRIVTPERLAMQLETRVFSFRYLRPQDLYRPKIKADTLVGDPKPNEEAVREFSIIEALKSALTRRGDRPVGSLQYVSSTNSVIVTDTGPVLAQIGAAIARLDVEPYQVHLEVKVVSTRNSDLAQVGIRYTTGDASGVSVGTSTLFVPNKPYVTGAGGLAPASSTTIRRSRLPFGIGNDFVATDLFWATDLGITATLRLFQEDATSRLEQAPSLSVLSDTEATIFVGESIRWANVEVAATQAGGTTTSVVEAPGSPIQVGFQLLIIPHVVPGSSQIVMTVIPQTNTLTGGSSILPGFEEFQLVGDDADLPGAAEARIFLPRVATSTVVTRMLVESGNTAVVAGLIEDRDGKTIQKLPGLGDIPIVGHLFRDTDTRKTRNHLIVFITPRLVRGAGETAGAVSERLEREKAAESSESDRLREGKSRGEWAERLRQAREKERLEHERLRGGR